jgi:hypothetical protein
LVSASFGAGMGRSFLDCREGTVVTECDHQARGISRMITRARACGTVRRVVDGLRS